MLGKGAGEFIVQTNKRASNLLIDKCATLEVQSIVWDGAVPLLEMRPLEPQGVGAHIVWAVYQEIQARRLT